MTFIERVTNLLSKNVEDIISSTDSLDLLKCYSILFNDGKQCRSCAMSQREYYKQLSLNGLKKAKEMDEIKARTCQPNWGKGCTNNNGLKFIHREGNHYSSLYITDDQAISLLNRGLLNESDFDILPEGYSKPLPKFDETPSPKKEVKKRTPKQ